MVKESWYEAGEKPAQGRDRVVKDETASREVALLGQAG